MLLILDHGLETQLGCLLVLLACVLRGREWSVMPALLCFSPTSLLQNRSPAIAFTALEELIKQIEYKRFFFPFWGLHKRTECVYVRSISPDVHGLASPVLRRTYTTGIS